MKVLLASTGADISSGAARCLIELAAKLIENNIEVLVTIPKHGNIEKELLEKKIPYKYVHEYHSWYTSEKHKKNPFFIKKILNYKCFLAFRKIIREERIDIVHENALTAYVAAWAAESLNVPVIWHIREFMEEDLKIRFYDRKKAIQIINKSTHIIAISKAIYEKWSNIFAAPMSVIYDGLPIENYYVEREWKIKKNEYTKIIIYGRIVEPKGQLFFVKAMKEVFSNCDRKIKCYLAGQVEDQVYFDKINDFIKDNKLNGCIEYLGQLDDMKKVLSNMDIVAICSQKEGFGRVTVEAMLAGCAVIGSDSGATCELINDDVNGILYSQANVADFAVKMKSLINNPEYVQKIARNAQLYALENFSLNKNAENIIDIYKKYK